MQRLIGMLLAVIVCCGGAVSFAQQTPVRAWAALFARQDPAGSRAEIDAVLKACGDDPEKLKVLIDADSAYRAFPAGWIEGRGTVGTGEEQTEMEFFVRVPRGYDPKRSYPLLLAAHARGGNGRRIGAAMLQLLDGEAEDYVIVAPNLPGHGRFSARAYQLEAFLDALAWARVNLNIDDDRIYVSGYSLGGHVAWHLGTMYPRLLAGAVPMAGVPWFQGVQVTHTMYLENLANLSVWAIWGEKDTAKPPALGTADLCRAAAERLRELKNEHFRGTEVPGVAHEGAWADGEQFRAFLRSHRRRAVPTEFAHFFHLDHHARGYYLQALRLAHRQIDFSKRISVVIPSSGKRPTRAETRLAIRKHVAKYMFQMWGRLDRRSNSLRARARGIRSIRLYVTEGMFDLSRPVTIRFWSRKWRGRIAASARCMLNHYAAERDRTALVYNELDLDISGKVTVRFE